MHSFRLLLPLLCIIFCYSVDDFEVLILCSPFIKFIFIQDVLLISIGVKHCNFDGQLLICCILYHTSKWSYSYTARQKYCRL